MSKPDTIPAAAPVEVETPAGDAASKPTRKRHAHAKGRGTLTLRGNIYQARWVVGGKVYVRSTKTNKKKEAERLLEQWTEDFYKKSEAETVDRLIARRQGIKAEIARYEDEKPALTIAETFDAYERAQNRPDSGTATMSMYQSQFGRFEKWIAAHHADATELRHVSQGIADEFAEYIGATFSANTFNKYRTLFGCIWDTLKDTARLTLNPWANIRRKVQIGHTRRELTVDELARVCGSLTGEMRLLFAVGIYTGLRLGDCALLEWGSVDLRRWRIVLTPRKTARHAHGKPVTIPLHKTLAAMLAETPTSQRTGYVLPQIAADYQHDTAALSVKIQKIFADCGIRTQAEKKSEGDRARVDVGFHSLRHTYVSLCANAGVPLAVVQSIVGHTSPAMTLHYFHESDAALNTAVAALPDITADRPDTGTGDTAAPDPLMVTFREIVGRMTAAQRAEAKTYLEGLTK